MIVGHRRATTGAARWQRQRDNGAERPCCRVGDRADGSHRCLSRTVAAGTSRGVNAANHPSDIFDRAARRQRRDRAAGRYADHAFLRDVMVEGLLERVDAIKRGFDDVLDIGTPDTQLAVPGARVARVDAGFRFAKAAGGVQAEEDRLPFADASFDGVLSAGVLDQVNDLPGALTLIRRVLRPDGVFLGAFLGGGSLPALRAALRVAEGDRPAARLHPQIDVRSAGDLLMRADFALPVADVETFDVRYASFGRLLDDLRGMAASNILIDRTAMSRETLARAAGAFAAAAGPDGRTTERFAIVFVTGWAPDPSQPKPARRGSASASLAAALRVPQ
jgi:SAM-dependent methyltransferase